jgi:hypothetical protein
MARLLPNVFKLINVFFLRHSPLAFRACPASAGRGAGGEAFRMYDVQCTMYDVTDCLSPLQICSHLPLHLHRLLTSYFCKTFGGIGENDGTRRIHKQSALLIEAVFGNF